MITTKREFLKAVSRKSGKTFKEVESLYNDIIEVILENARSADENETLIPDIGRLIVKTTPSHLAYNPRELKHMLARPGRTAKLKLKPKFIDEINEGYDVKRRSYPGPKQRELNRLNKKKENPYL